MVHGLWCAWCAHVMAGEALDLSPEGDEPDFKFVLRGVREKLVVRSYPAPHFLLGITGVNEVVPPGIHIGQGDDGIRGSQ